MGNILKFIIIIGSCNVLTQLWPLRGTHHPALCFPVHRYAEDPFFFLLSQGIKVAARLK